LAIAAAVSSFAVEGCGGRAATLWSSDAGASAGDDAAAGNLRCHVGETIACTCSDGTISVQECLADGTRAACECGLDPLDPRRSRDGGAAGAPPGARDAAADLAASGDAAGPQPRLVLLPGNDVVADPARDLVYLSVRADAPEAPSSVVAIVPGSGAIAWSLALSPEPGPLAISDDGSKLYVGFATAPRVERIDLGTHLSELQLALGTQDGEERHAGDLAVLPGAPRSVVVSMRKGGNFYFATVAVFDDATPRATTLPDYQTADIIQAASATTVCALNRSDTSASFYVLSVSPGGIQLASKVDNLFDDFLPGMSFHAGLAFGWDGRVVDPATLKLVGSRHDMVGPVVPAALDGNTIIAAGNPADDQLQVRVGVFAPDTHARLRAYDLPETGVAKGAVVAHDGTLALLVDGVPPGRRRQMMLLLIDASSLR
jgi:hypothetical protein